jgi:hypothetical protein
VAGCRETEPVQLLPEKPGKEAEAEGAMKRAKYVASFIGLAAGKAHFVGLYGTRDQSRLDTILRESSLLHRFSKIVNL